MWSRTDGRNVLEWRMDPTSPDSIEQARQPGFTPIIVSSSYLVYTPFRSFSTLSVLDSTSQIRENLTTRCATKATHHP